MQLTEATLNPLAELTAPQRSALGLIRRLGQCSRGEIGRHFEWGAPAVSKTLRPLLDAGMLLSESVAQPGQERRQALLQLNPDLVCAIGISLSFTSVSLALVNLGGQILERGLTFSTLDLAPKEILDRIQCEVNRLQSEHSERQIVGSGVAFAGIVVNPDDLTRNFPETQPWSHVPLRRLLRAHCPGILVVRNDTIAALLAELRYGCALRCRNALYLYMVEGISLGLLSNGHIHSGHSRNSGEFGHISVIANGPFCHCGGAGCLESVASSWAILKQMRELMRDGVNIPLEGQPEGAELSLEMVSHAAQDGTPLARNLMSRAGELMGNLLAMTANIIDPQKIILGGILSQEPTHPTLIHTLEESFQRGLYSSRPTPIGIELSPLGLDAALVGAAALVFERLLPATPPQLEDAGED